MPNDGTSNIFGNEESNTGDQPNTTVVSPVLQELVGDGKKFKSEVDLANGYVHSQNHISTLESENAELRNQLNERESVSTMLQEIKDRTSNVNQSGQTSQVGAEEITDLVRGVMRQESQAEIQAQNLNASVNALVTYYEGDTAKAEAAVASKAAELGVSKDWLKSMGATSPKAFTEFMGINTSSNMSTPKDSGASPPPSENVNSADSGGPKEGTWSYYSKIRKENPKLYRSPSVQNALFRDAQKAAESGVDFYST